MLFSRPQPFEAALAHLRQKRLLPTTLSSAELSRLSAQTRELALFSARTTIAEHLQVIRNVSSTLADGRTDLATAKLELKKSLAARGFTPSTEDRGTLRDLSSEVRRELVVRMNTEMAQGAGRFASEQDPDFLDAWPAKELVRDRASEVPRKWHQRWAEAAAAVGDGDAARMLATHGRMIARQDSPVWRQLSRFGQPHDPFDYHSGMGLEIVSRSEAVELGLMPVDAVVEPQPVDLTAGREARPAITDPDLRARVVRELGGDYEWQGDVLTRRAAA